MSAENNEMAAATSPVNESTIDLSTGIGINSLSSGKEGNDEDTPPYWSTHGLPKSPDEDGRFAWEPPELDYSEYIGEEYEKKREVMLKFLKGDKARTTELMDVDIEQYLLNEYGGWTWGRRDRAPDIESERFFDGLYSELSIDLFDVEHQWYNNGCYTFEEIGGGKYEVIQYRGDNRVHYFNNTIDDLPYRMRIIRIDQEPQVTENHRISSANDEAKELALLEYIDVEASRTEPPTMHMPPTSPTPLALHMVSLRSNASMVDAGNQPASMDNEEEVD